MPNSPPDDQWVRQHYDRLRRAAWLLTGDAWRADDLTQETFVRAITSWNQFDGRSSASTWLYSILLNVDRSQRRAVGRAEQLVRRWVARRCGGTRDSSDPRQLLAEQLWKESIWAKVKQLPIAQQQAIMLRFGEGLALDEIATIQQCAIGTVQSRIYYGLKKLRREMDGQDWTLFAADCTLPAVTRPTLP